MINNYVNKLIENIPLKINKNNKPLEIDLVLDGGLFNGSYLIGSLYFLREMEKQNYIKIKRISGCSIGSLIGLLYLINKLELFEELYNLFLNSFKISHDFNKLLILHNYLLPHLPSNIDLLVNNKFYVTFYDMKHNKKIIKNKYTNLNNNNTNTGENVINCIIKSCFIPFLIDNNMLYKSRYIDGINPYLFNKIPNRKILFLDLFGVDKIFCTINVKNENNNIHRILCGLLDVHNFFIKQSQTSMCSFVDEWNIYNKLRYSFKKQIELLFMYFIRILIQIKLYFKFSHNLHNNIFYQIYMAIIKDIYIILLQKYCI